MCLVHVHSGDFLVYFTRWVLLRLKYFFVPHPSLLLVVTIHVSVFVLLQLRRRVYKGIPNAMRCEVWKKLLGLEKIPSKSYTYEVRKVVDIFCEGRLNIFDIYK